MSNQAAAIVVLPIAIQMATQLHLNPRTFVMLIAVAASCSYLTPLEPSCLIVYGPGRYKFIDFLKVGSLLTIHHRNHRSFHGAKNLAFTTKIIQVGRLQKI